MSTRSLSKKKKKCLISCQFLYFIGIIRKNKVNYYYSVNYKIIENHDWNFFSRYKMIKTVITLNKRGTDGMVWKLGQKDTIGSYVEVI